MADKTLQDIAEIIADIDFCQFGTITDGGLIAARPMSSNAQVENDCDTWFFSKDTTRTYRDIEANPHVTLTFHGSAGIMGVVGKPGPMVAIQGRAEIIRDKAVFKDHWVPELEFWFKDGIDDPHMVMFKVHARRVNLWDGMDTCEITV